MAKLTHEIASDIVERTMQILTHNINVMDEHGVIIGSGQKSRLGQLHEGALQVIHQRRRIDLDQKESQYLKGTKPGINLPIVFKKQIVGVIGISGDPQSISQFGELVKMGAELTLKQAALTEQLQWDERLREELVNDIIHNKIDTLSTERAHRMGIDLTVNRVPILFEFETVGMSEINLSKQKQRNFIDVQSFLGEDDLIASVGAARFVILIKNDEHHQMDIIHEKIHDMLKHLHYRSEVRWWVGIGAPFSHIEQASQSYNYARSTLEVGKILVPEKEIYFYEDFFLPILISHFNLPEGTMFRHYDALVKEDKSGILQKTLQVYIKENGDLSTVAEQLFIHRNTLRYRLDRINDITGKNPRNINDLLHLYVSQIAYKLND